MAFGGLDSARSALLVIDVQPSLIPFVFEAERTVDRVTFMIRAAHLLDVPVLATEQNPAKMGATDPGLRPLLDLERTFSKMTFSADGCPELLAAVEASARRQIVIVGMETHICVSQTARGLLRRGYEVWVCPDGVSARTVDRHRLGMEQIRDAGVMPAHTEAVAYEWIGSADHSRFREFLTLVKES